MNFQFTFNACANTRNILFHQKEADISDQDAPLNKCPRGSNGRCETTNTKNSHFEVGIISQLSRDLSIEYFFD